MYMKNKLYKLFFVSILIILGVYFQSRPILAADNCTAMTPTRYCQTGLGGTTPDSYYPVYTPQGLICREPERWTYDCSGTNSSCVVSGHNHWWRTEDDCLNNFRSYAGCCGTNNPNPCTACSLGDCPIGTDTQANGATGEFAKTVSCSNACSDKSKDCYYLCTIPTCPDINPELYDTCPATAPNGCEEVTATYPADGSCAAGSLQCHFERSVPPDTGTGIILYYGDFNDEIQQSSLMENIGRSPYSPRL